MRRDHGAVRRPLVCPHPCTAFVCSTPEVAVGAVVFPLRSFEAFLPPMVGFTTGGVAALNHRLITATPSGVERATAIRGCGKLMVRRPRHNEGTAPQRRDRSTTKKPPPNDQPSRISRTL